MHSVPQDASTCSASGTGTESEPYDLSRECSVPAPRKVVTFDVSYCVAPMVGQSDLPFRLLCLRHGASICWTEMLFSDRVLTDPGYCKHALSSCPEEESLIVQLCGNDPLVLGNAAAVIEASCRNLAAIDLNLGFPQKSLLDRESTPPVQRHTDLCTL